MTSGYIFSLRLHAVPLIGKGVEKERRHALQKKHFNKYKKGEVRVPWKGSKRNLRKMTLMYVKKKQNKDTKSQEE